MCIDEWIPAAKIELPRFYQHSSRTLRVLKQSPHYLLRIYISHINYILWEKTETSNGHQLPTKHC